MENVERGLQRGDKLKLVILQYGRIHMKIYDQLTFFQVSERGG